ncbi:hypothetical protein V2J09_001246 [Rumex salicifolius]
MDSNNMNIPRSQDDNYKEEEEEQSPLPGFRFHPTDDELVSFYLKRKVQNRPISMEIIEQIDIYKHDPWELAKGKSVGDKEWYFYCKRGRKYRNSVRPNRVIAGSGFWKATGIDRPVYSDGGGGGGQGRSCVGLKKSLVYYRGCAGKGAKTDWMMHEFRLLPTHNQTSGANPNGVVTTLQEAEVWTLCRIFKRNQKHTPNRNNMSTKRVVEVANYDNYNNSDNSCYITFVNPTQRHEQESFMTKDYSASRTDTCGLLDFSVEQWMAQSASSDASNFSSPLNPSSSTDDQSGHFVEANWDDLSSIIEFASLDYPLGSYEGHIYGS